MESSELNKIWQTLSNENLIDKSIAKENIERIIKQDSSETISKLSKKIKFDYMINMSAAILVIAITIFATMFLNNKNQSLPIQGYIFLVLVITYYIFKAVSLKSKLKLLNISYNTSSILESLKMVKTRFEKTPAKESVIIYVSLTAITVFANLLLNEKTGFSNFTFNSLQGFVLIFSVVYLVSLPFFGKYYFNKRFSGIISDLNNSIDELSSNK